MGDVAGTAGGHGVRIEGRTKAEVSRDYGVSPRWVYELCRRFETEGETGLEPRSRRPRASPRRTPVEIEDEIVELRKDLLDQGFDAGAHTIAVHLGRRHGEGAVPSVATIWRILSRRGFVTPQPRKRPKLVHPVPGRHAERTLAGRHHPLEVGR